MNLKLLREIITHEFEQIKAESAIFRRLFSQILVGAQNSAHPVFNRITAAIPDHLHPAGEFFPFLVNSVISYSVVFSDECLVIPENGRPLKPWVLASREFRNLSCKLNQRIARIFPEHQFQEPFSSQLYDREVSKTRIGSNWSERHIAYACGLGTFGRHYSLITEKGSCHRLGSLVSDMEISGPPKVLKGIMDNCLVSRGINCRSCIKGCPVGAIDDGKKDLWTCYLYEDESNGAYLKQQYGIDGASCGVCLLNNPCTTGIPGRHSVKE